MSETPMSSSAITTVSIPCEEGTTCKLLLSASASASVGPGRVVESLTILLLCLAVGAILVVYLVPTSRRALRKTRRPPGSHKYSNGLSSSSNHSTDSMISTTESVLDDSSRFFSFPRRTTYVILIVGFAICATLQIGRTSIILGNLTVVQQDIDHRGVVPTEMLKNISISTSPGLKKWNQHDVKRNSKELNYLKTRRKVISYLRHYFPGPRAHSSGPPPCQGDRIIDFQLHVLGWNRLENLQHLLNSINEADYSGWSQEIPLYIHIDGGSLPAVNELAETFDWTRGPKILDIRQKNHGLRNMWFTSMRNATQTTGDDTLMLVLEDDMVISPLYFQWLLRMVDRYARNPTCRDSNLFGFSLSPIVRQNLYKPFYKWDADKELAALIGRKKKRHSAYLSSIPSSWGGAYFSDHWKRFDEFVKIRMQDAFYNTTAELIKNEKAAKKDAWRAYDPWRMTPQFLHLPNDCATKYWKESWKRILVDLMYAQGQFMIYPNLARHEGLAYARQSSGQHVNSKNKGLYQVPLFTDPSKWGEMERELPAEYKYLKLIDLEHRRNSREIAMALGTKYLNEVFQGCKGDKCPELLKQFYRRDWSIPSNGYEWYPRICVADLYLSTAAERIVQVDPMKDIQHQIAGRGAPGVKYLVIPKENLNDVTRAEIIAEILGRQLVLLSSVNVAASRRDEVSSPSSRKSAIDQYPDAKLIRLGRNSTYRSPFTWWPSKDARYKVRRVVQVSKRGLPQQVLDIFQPAQTIDLTHMFDAPHESLQHMWETIQVALGGCPDDVLIWDGLPALPDT